MSRCWSAEEPLLLWSLLSRRFGERPYLVAAAEELAIPPVVLRSIAPTPESIRIVSRHRLEMNCGSAESQASLSL